MSSLGFENYAEALKIYLSKYREVGLPLCLRPHSPLYLPRVCRLLILSIAVPVQQG
jgi:hypothetical protein